MKLQTTIVVAAWSGCVGTSPTRIIGDTVGAAGAALLGESFQAGSNAAAWKVYDAGYEKDAARQQYRTLNTRQRLAPRIEAAARISPGTTVLTGMPASTCLAVVFLPPFYVVLQRFAERRTGS